MLTISRPDTGLKLKKKMDGKLHSKQLPKDTHNTTKVINAWRCLTMCTGQDSKPLSLLVVIEADGASVVRVSLAELARRYLLQRSAREPVTSGAAPVLYTFHYLKVLKKYRLVYYKIHKLCYNFMLWYIFFSFRIMTYTTLKISTFASQPIY